MEFSPGIQYLLLPNIGAIVGPPLILIAVNYALVSFFPAYFDLLPFWLRALFLILSWPAALVLSTVYKHVRDSRRAAALGAVIIAPISYKLPWGLDLLVKLLKEVRSGYIG